MLAELSLTGFKSFAITGPIPLAPVTILLGANASGKSNFLDALRFLQGLSLQIPIGEVLRGRSEAGREVWPGIRGGPAEAISLGKKSFKVESRWSSRHAPIFRHSIECAVNPEPQVIAESLYDDKSYLFDSQAPSLGGAGGPGSGGILRVALRRVGKGKSLSQDYSAHRSVLGQVRAIEKLAPAVLEAQRDTLAALGASLFLDLNPRRMRDYVPGHHRQLGAEGENLSGVLWQLAQDSETRTSIVDWLCELCAPAVTDLDFVETELGDVMVRLVEPPGKVSVRSLSDGTLRFLGLLTALLTAPRDSLLLVEEIENGLHPSRVRLLAGLLEAVPLKRGFQVIVTTHSPRLLQQLTPKTLADALLFARLPDGHSSLIQPLGKLPNFEEVRQRRGIEYLFETNWLERAL